MEKQLPGVNFIEFREVRGQDDFWVAEIPVRFDHRTANFGVSVLELREGEIGARRSTSTEGWEPPEWRAPWRAAP